MEQEISELVSQALESLSGFETLEALVRDTSLRIGAGILESMMNADKSDCHSTLIHPDGTIMHYIGRREKTFVTVLGDITLKRAYYSDEEGRGYYPRDEKLGLDKDSLSPGVKVRGQATPPTCELPVSPYSFYRRNVWRRSTHPRNGRIISHNGRGVAYPRNHFAGEKTCDYPPSVIGKRS